MLPILSRIAKRVMAASACSSDVERLFSRAGIIFSPFRNYLKPETIQFLTTLHYWYIEEDGIEESNAARNVESARRADKFAKLAIENRITLSIADGVDYYVSDSSADD